MFQPSGGAGPVLILLFMVLRLLCLRIHGLLVGCQLWAGWHYRGSIAHITDEHTFRSPQKCCEAIQTILLQGCNVLAEKRKDMTGALII